MSRKSLSYFLYVFSTIEGRVQPSFSVYSGGGRVQAFVFLVNSLLIFMILGFFTVFKCEWQTELHVESRLWCRCRTKSVDVDPHFLIAGKDLDLSAVRRQSIDVRTRYNISSSYSTALWNDQNMLLSIN